jgi:hypothetical protein
MLGEKFCCMRSTRTEENVDEAQMLGVLGQHGCGAQKPHPECMFFKTNSLEI